MFMAATDLVFGRAVTEHGQIWLQAIFSAGL